MVSTFLGEVGFGTLSLGIGALQVLLGGDVPKLLTNAQIKIVFPLHSLLNGIQECTAAIRLCFSFIQ
jgi:hypothetical protein